MIYSYIIIILILLILCVIFATSQYDHFTTQSNEAVQDIASVYNKANMTTTNLNVTGALNVDGPFNILPTGSIIAWYPPTNAKTPPPGWAICDGTQGTPDLRGRFILSAGQGSGLTTRVPGSIGGEENHILTINEMPSHSHTVRAGNNNSYSNCWCSCICSGRNGLSSDDNRGTSAVGGSAPHNNMPPFYVLTYIMKL